jgi:hypothetical protein
VIGSATDHGITHFYNVIWGVIITAIHLHIPAFGPSQITSVLSSPVTENMLYVKFIPNFFEMATAALI